jgi:cytochrome c peroxidase
MSRSSSLAALLLLATACVDSTAPSGQPDWTPVTDVLVIDPTDLPNYASPTLPAYYVGGVIIREVRIPLNNPVTNAGATLGRVLFFDPQLSRTVTTSCASCHHQSLGFGDSAQFSLGFEGVGRTGAHSMRLGNARFNESGEYFWDRRAPTLEAQATQPIRDAVEMGFDDAHGGFGALITRLEGLAYYPPLFQLAFGDAAITEDRVQKALAQYVRSILSVNSKWDAAFAQVPVGPGPGLNFLAPLPGFTDEELRGRDLFIRPRPDGGLGCQGCHVAPSFSLADGSGSNGLDAGETRIFRAPSLKNLALSQRFMHDGRFTSIEEVVEFYNSGIQAGPALDTRLLEPGGGPQRLNLSVADKAALAAFLRTLTDLSVTTDARFASPFKP